MHKGQEFTKKSVRQFIQDNYKPYTSSVGAAFLCGATDKTKKLCDKIEAIMAWEREGQAPRIGMDRIGGIGVYSPGYIDKDLELIVGLQTDEPLKRAINPFGGKRMVYDALEAYGKQLAPHIEHEIQGLYTHNEAVFSKYTQQMKSARRHGLLTGLPDAYGRGRIIGDYRRLPLYGLKEIIAERIACFKQSTDPLMTRELDLQVSALHKIDLLAKSYGYDLSEPAKNAHEAVQHLYFAYLAGVQENNGAAMSLGRVSTFLDIYIERDLERGLIDESFAQELIDQLVLKLRLVRHLRTPEYDQLFAGDPNWITEALGGIGLDGRCLVTKTTYRFLHTLVTIGPSPEPNMTVLWSNQLPPAFKDYCVGLSVQTSAIQYESDELMRPIYGDDYGIACCVSAMRLGEQMQYFGARCNLAKALLYAINGGVDELSGQRVIESISPMFDPTKSNEPLDYERVKKGYFELLEHIASLYVDTMNIIHESHDEHAYESSLMAFHNKEVERLMAFGVAGLSIVADSLSAIRYATVIPVVKNGIAIDFKVFGQYPQYGNDIDSVDQIAVEVLRHFKACLNKKQCLRGAKATLSVLTITSNVVYGKKTGATPCGRKAGTPFAPGANPLHGREKFGPLASMATLAKIPYEDVCEDGISYTFTAIPSALGGTLNQQTQVMTTLIDHYMLQGGHHINVNVLEPELLKKAMSMPELYPNLTLRVSGYAVRFVSLTVEQQNEVIERCYHKQVGLVIA